MARNRGSELVIILWRDIPAQVNGRSGAEKHQWILPRRFQKAIDRAAMVAGKKTAQEYVAEWRRTATPIEGDMTAAVDDTAARFEAEFTEERLAELVANGGWDPASPEEHDPDPEPGDDPGDDPDDEPNDEATTDTTDSAAADASAPAPEQDSL